VKRRKKKMIDKEGHRLKIFTDVAQEKYIRDYCLKDKERIESLRKKIEESNGLDSGND
jgi:chorismate mutase